MIYYGCAGCQAPMSSPDSLAGDTDVCKACGAQVAVPAGGPAISTSVARSASVWDARLADAQARNMSPATLARISAQRQDDSRRQAASASSGGFWMGLGAIGSLVAALGGLVLCCAVLWWLWGWLQAPTGLRLTLEVAP